MQLNQLLTLLLYGPSRQPSIVFILPLSSSSACFMIPLVYRFYYSLFNYLLFCWYCLCCILLPCFLRFFNLDFRSQFLDLPPLVMFLSLFSFFSISFVLLHLLSSFSLALLCLDVFSICFTVSHFHQRLCFCNMQGSRNTVATFFMNVKKSSNNYSGVSRQATRHHRQQLTT